MLSNAQEELIIDGAEPVVHPTGPFACRDLRLRFANGVVFLAHHSIYRLQDLAQSFEGTVFESARAGRRV